MPSPEQYSRLQIVLHWTVVVLVAAQLVLGDAMGTAFEALHRGFTASTATRIGANAHAIIGGVIFLVAASRLYLRLARGVPDIPHDGPPLLQRLAAGTHWALYATILAMPVLGAIAWYGGVRFAGDLHSALWSLLLILIALHVAGALTEHFVLRTQSLNRILGRKTAD